MAKNSKLTANIPGLISLFGDSLYSDFGAVLRELVQNGHDAIILRSEKDPTEGRIRVSYSQSHSLLSVSDDGCGMTAEDVESFLNDFGNSYKQNEAQRIRASGGHLKYAELIGQYGVGFLSALAASESVEVYTSRNSASVTWKYSHGADVATIERISHQEYASTLGTYGVTGSSVGTLVVCRLRPQFVRDHRVDEASVLRHLKKYTALLPVRVYFKNDCVNEGSMLWEGSGDYSDTDWTDAVRRLHDAEPHFPTVLRDVPEEYQATGVLYVRPPEAFHHARSAVDVYIKRMYVTSGCPAVVPSWAPFCGGVLNSNALTRLLSGEGVKEDQLTARFRQYLEQQILHMIRRISDQSQLYRQILGPYAEIIKRSAIQSNDLLEAVWNRIPIPVASGEQVTMDKYLGDVRAHVDEMNDATIYRYTSVAEKVQAEAVSSTTGIPVLDLSNEVNDCFVEAVAHLKNVEIHSLRDLARTHFTEPRDSTSFEKLRGDSSQFGANVMIRCFEPSYVPAMLIGRGRRGSALSKNADVNQDADFDFYLNADNPLIQDLRVTDDSYVRKQVLRGLYNFAIVPAFPDLKPRQIETIHNSIQDIMQGLVGHSGMLHAEADRGSALGEAATNAMRGNLVEGDYAIVLHDIIGSTWALSNLGDPTAAELFHKYCAEVERLARENLGHFDKFTGDGAMVLFTAAEDEDDLPVRRASRFAQELVGATRRVFTHKGARMALDAVGVPFHGSRTTIAFGKCLLGQFGGGLSLVGLPVVAAARIMSAEELFPDRDMILLTEAASRAGNHLANEVEVVRRAFEAKGLPMRLVVLKLL